MAVKLIGMLLLLLALQSPLEQTPPEQAETAYLEGDYMRAITLYETMVTEGSHSPAIFFNLGSAYYQLGQLGRAIVNFHRAHAAQPRDIETQARIELIRAERADLQSGEHSIIARIADSTSNILSFGELAIVTLIIWSAWFGMLTVFWFMPTLANRLRLYKWGAACILAVVLVLFGTRLYMQEFRPLAVVNVPAAQIMSGPGQTYLPLYQLFDAAEIRIIKQLNGWARFVLPDGRQGWISETDFEFV